MYTDTAEKAGTTPKARGNFWSWHAESYLIRGERELARTDCTLAPPSVNYMGPCCHLNLQGNFGDRERWKPQEGFSANPSACRTSRLWPEQRCRVN